MTKRNHRTSNGFPRGAAAVGVMLLALVGTLMSNWPSADAASQGSKKAAVSGTATLTYSPDQKTLTVKLTLKNVPAGTHAAHLHKGACAVNFAQGPGHVLDAKNFFNVGSIKATGGKVDLSKTFTTSDNAAALKSNPLQNPWFLCIHFGALKGVTKNSQVVAAVKAATKNPKGPEAKQLNEIVCVNIIPDGSDPNTATLNFTKPEK